MFISECHRQNSTKRGYIFIVLTETSNLSKTKLKNFHFTDAALENLIDEVISASNRGVSASGNVSGAPNWSFGQSLFFSSTVVTTIGNKNNNLKIMHYHYRMR